MSTKHLVSYFAAHQRSPVLSPSLSPTTTWLGKIIIACLAVIALYGWLPSSLLAQANCEKVACVSASPRLASLDTKQSTLLNGVLSSLLGANVNLSVADANAVAQGEVNLTDLLGGLQSNLTLASPEAVLNADLTLAQVVAALAQVSNNAATINALNTLTSTTNLPTATIKLADLLQLQTAAASLSNVNLNVLDLLTGSIQLFNQKNVATTPTPITLSGSALGLNGVLNSVTLRAQVVEPPVIICGKAGAQFYSAAIRLSLALDLVDVNLANALSISLVGFTVDASVAVGQLTVYTVIGRGAGTISAINAASNAVTIQATPGVADIYLGNIPAAIFFNRSTGISSANLDFANIGTLNITLTPLIGAATAVSAIIEAKTFATGDNPTATTLNFVAPYPKTQTASTSATFVANLLRACLKIRQWPEQDA